MEGKIIVNPPKEEDVAEGQGLTTIVIDAGARYGLHPTWHGFTGDLKYFAFEPDLEEVVRLKEKNVRPEVEFIGQALGGQEGRREFHLWEHRGYSSFLEPDPDSLWFRDRGAELGETGRTVAGVRRP